MWGTRLVNIVSSILCEKTEAILKFKRNISSLMEEIILIK